MLMRTVMTLTLIGVLSPAMACSAAEQGKTYVDATKAGPDYAVQGEYTGKIATDDGVNPWGLKIVALGNNEFSAVGYEGGLPGDGWQRGDQTVEGKGKRSNGTVRFEGDVWEAQLKDGKLTVYGPGGDVVGTLKKVHRKSPTLGAKPLKGARVLFDGTNTDEFVNGHLVMGNLLAAGCSTRAKFKDHTLHIEFRTPFKPSARGQKRGNSGVYMQSRYEVQVLDSFGLEGKNNECGGIYSIAAPRLNMCFPPLTWQTYDIDFTAARYGADGKKLKNARITVRHNGIVIMDDLELPHGTPGRLPEGPNPAPLFLQGHGNPVAFKNIWVIEK